MRRQREFVELLKLRQAGPEFATRLHQWLLDWDHGRTPEYAHLSEEVYHQRLKFYTAVDKLLTREQRQHALGRLQKYADDCKTLSARPAAHTGDTRHRGDACLRFFDCGHSCPLIPAVSSPSCPPSAPPYSP